MMPADLVSRAAQKAGLLTVLLLAVAVVSASVAEEEAEASFSPGDSPATTTGELDEIDAYGEGYLDACGVLEFR